MARTSSKDKENKSSKSKIVKTIPNSETGKVDCANGKYLITENHLKEQFTLWKCLDDGFEKIKTSDNPLDFDDVIDW